MHTKTVKKKRIIIDADRLKRAEVLEAKLATAMRYSRALEKLKLDPEQSPRQTVIVARLKQKFERITMPCVKMY